MSFLQDKLGWTIVLYTITTLAHLGLICGCTTNSTDDPQSRQGIEKPMTLAERVMLGKYDLERMTAGERAEAGEILVFGRLTSGTPGQADIGKGMCPLCHRVTGLIEKKIRPPTSRPTTRQVSQSPYAGKSGLEIPGTSRANLLKWNRFREAAGRPTM